MTMLDLKTVISENCGCLSLVVDEKIVSLEFLLRDLSKSHEYYAACNSPKEEWDEYDYMIYPIWLRLKDFLGE